MICIGIDVAKDKHDCFILSSEGEVLADVFTIPNSMEGFIALYRKIQDVSGPNDKIKVGLEATGQSLPEKSQSPKNKDRSCRCAYDCNNAFV